MMSEAVEARHSIGGAPRREPRHAGVADDFGGKRARSGFCSSAHNSDYPTAPSSLTEETISGKGLRKNRDRIIVYL